VILLQAIFVLVEFFFVLVQFFFGTFEFLAHLFFLLRELLMPLVNGFGLLKGFSLFLLLSIRKSDQLVIVDMMTLSIFIIGNDGKLIEVLLNS
jgi:hypothetical protein